MKQIVFIGFGYMGVLMVINLFKVGYLLNVFDLVQSVVDGLVVVGVSVVCSVCDVVQGVDVVISMLLVSQYVEGLYFDDDGLFVYIVFGILVLECLIIVLILVCKVYVVVCECGLVMFDVLVFGGIVGVVVGILIFMVGGDVEVLEKVWLLFEVMGWNIFYVGFDGVGQVVKVCNNQFFVVLMIGIVEVMVLGVVNGFEVKVLVEIMCCSFGGNWVLEVYNFWLGVMENVLVLCDYSGGFMVQLMVKDFGLVQEVVQVSVSSMLMGSLVLSLYCLLLKQGYVEWDFFVVQKLFDLI